VQRGDQHDDGSDSAGETARSGKSGETVGGALLLRPQGRRMRRRPPPGASSTNTAPHDVQKRVVAALSERQFGQCMALGLLDPPGGGSPGGAMTLA
jgi:hypothetical protein